MQEVVRGATVALDAVYRDASDNLVDPVTPLVDILDPANVVIVADAVPVRSSLGLYDYPAGGYLVPTNADFGVWTARWTGTVDGDLIEALDEFEVVAALTSSSSVTYVTVDEVRALPGMADDGKYPDTDVEAAIAWFETKFEGYVGVAFVRREATERLAGGCTSIWLNHWPVRSVTAVRSFTSPTANTAFTVDEVADLLIDDTGAVRRYAAGYWPADVELDYTHWLTATAPADVKDAALVAVSEKLTEDANRGARANRQFAVATQEGIVRSSMPGDGRPFGIPVVDQVANDYRNRYRAPAMA